LQNYNNSYNNSLYFYVDIAPIQLFRGNIFDLKVEEEYIRHNSGVRINWMGIQTPTNCRHRADDSAEFNSVSGSGAVSPFWLLTPEFCLIKLKICGNSIRQYSGDRY